jgi:hypothetical protein
MSGRARVEGGHAWATMCTLVKEEGCGEELGMI